jgi:hypothetical protein
VPPPLPEELFDQAERLIGGQEPNQADFRRALSTVYYGLFHFVMISATDMIFGAEHRDTLRYQLVYRTVQHSQLRSICVQTSKQFPKLALVPEGGFGPVADFARLALNSAQLRLAADYDPLQNFSRSTVEITIANGRKAVQWFGDGTLEQRQTFLTLLLFEPRREAPLG